MTPFLTVMVLISCAIVVAAALDLFFGGKGIAALDRVLNKKIDTDTAIVKGLSTVRAKVESEVFNTDKVLSSSRVLQRTVAVLMLIAVAFLAYTGIFPQVRPANSIECRPVKRGSFDRRFPGCLLFLELGFFIFFMRDIHLKRQLDADVKNIEAS